MGEMGQKENRIRKRKMDAKTGEVRNKERKNCKRNNHMGETGNTEKGKMTRKREM